jgi:diguanylate cyclase (GGDEF)-like protein/putative nucleotidyltransferase with HDIG domain
VTSIVARRLVLVVLAAVGVWLFVSRGPFIGLLGLAPIYLSYRAILIYAGRLDAEEGEMHRAEETHLATVEALVRAIDAKGQTAHSRTHWEQIYAVGIARALGLPDDEIESVKVAALLHDVGKLAIPENILTKPGPLSEEEFAKIRTHPQAGADIVASVPFPHPVAPLIASHHERWDGAGYPRGLKGNEIPMGARILAVVDCFDALVSERPYQTPLSVASALAYLSKEAGQAFDPRVVAVFVQEYAALTAKGSRPRPQGAAERSVAPPAAVFQDIALAHREIYALYEIAAALGASLSVADTMTMLASKLRTIMPLQACALFLRDRDADVLRCRFATGVEAAALERFVLKAGEGLNGWVARTKRPLANAPPGADFEAAGDSRSTTLQAALVCPLVFSDQIIGTLAVYHTTAGVYTDSHRRLLDRVSEQAAAVIHNALAFEGAQSASQTDPLTGLPNRRSMALHVEREVARAGRLGTAGVVMVVDVRGAKELREKANRLVRDGMTARYARVMAKCLRQPDDLLGTTGRDAFVFLLAGASREDAAALQAAIEGQMATLSSEVGASLLAHAGVAVFPHDGETFEALCAVAYGRVIDRRTE